MYTFTYYMRRKFSHKQSLPLVQRSALKSKAPPLNLQFSFLDFIHNDEAHVQRWHWLLYEESLLLAQRAGLCSFTSAERYFELLCGNVLPGHTFGIALAAKRFPQSGPFVLRHLQSVLYFLWHSLWNILNKVTEALFTKLFYHSNFWMSMIFGIQFTTAPLPRFWTVPFEEALRWYLNGSENE